MIVATGYDVAVDYIDPTPEWSWGFMEHRAWVLSEFSDDHGLVLSQHAPLFFLKYKFDFPAFFAVLAIQLRQLAFAVEFFAGF